MAGPKPMMTEFGVHQILESCVTIHYQDTREPPGDTLVNISKWQIFAWNGNAFNYSEILKQLFFKKEMSFLH